MQPQTKQCQNCKKDFTIEPDDFAFYGKIKVPPPTWCPECRKERRMVFRNERRLFKRESGLMGEKLFSLYPIESDYVVYDDKDWWSQDKWDPLSFGLDFNFSRPFLLQFLELSKKVPKYHRAAINMINSDYSANAEDLKNCYLLFNSNFTEDSAYGNGVDFCRNCYDVSHIQKSERCYDSFWLTNCYEVYFSVQCEDCISVWFSKNCKDCQYCLGCVNQRSKKYCIFNEQYTKAEYEKKLEEMHMKKRSNVASLRKMAEEFWLKFPNKYLQGVNNQNVSGEYITHSRNIKKSFLVRECENLKYVQYSQVPSSKDCMDSTIIGNKTELLYECSVCGWGSADMRFCLECWDGGHGLEYSMFCGRSASDLFGCVGILKQQYCILNKQYTKEEYFALKLKIIKHMNDMPYVDRRGRIYKYGEFFPPEFSPFAYNHTIAIEHFSRNKNEVEKFGMNWDDKDPHKYAITINLSELPDSIKNITEEIANEVIECVLCKRAYRIIPSELSFLKHADISLPDLCIDCRHNRRISHRSKSKIYPRKCMCDKEGHGHKGKCHNEFETSYAPERPEIVYCESCYQREVY